MLAAVTGQRMLFNYFRIGGVNGDVNHEFMSRLGDWMSRATEQHRRRTPRCSTRTRSSSAGCAASAARPRDGAPDGRHRPEPAGRRRPVRRPPGAPVLASTRSSSSTSRPRHGRGRRLDRYLLRVDEIKQSLRIIDQCLHNMPDGPVMAKLPRLLRPRPGRAWAAIEGPRGLYGDLRDQDGTDQPFRMQHPRPVVRPPPARRPADAGQPDRRHDGRHGQPRPDHGRRRQVSRAVERSAGRGWSTLARRPRCARGGRLHDGDQSRLGNLTLPGRSCCRCCSSCSSSGRSSRCCWACSSGRGCCRSCPPTSTSSGSWSPSRRSCCSASRPRSSSSTWR